MTHSTAQGMNMGRKLSDALVKWQHFMKAAARLARETSWSVSACPNFRRYRLLKTKFFKRFSA